MLQGSLDDFALDEVLGLLASTSKSGRLRLSGNRGTGSLWLDKGHLTAAEASKIPGRAGVEDVVFEMLRFADGTFSFMIDDVPTEIGSPEQVDFVVQLAQDRLAEWRTIESVVPSLAHTISLADELPGEELEISRSEWKTVIAVGGNATVKPVCEQLGLDEVDGSRRIMQMIQRGLLTISDPADAAKSASTVVVAEAVIPEPSMVAEVASSVALSAEPVEAPAPVFAETVVAQAVVAEAAPVAEVAAPVAEETIVEVTPEAVVVEAVGAETVVAETVPTAEEVFAPIETVVADTVIAEIAPGALPERPSGAESVLATSASTDFMSAVPAAEVAPVKAAPVAEVEHAQAPASDPFAPPPGPSPFGLNTPIEAPASSLETESSEGRPPMPPPPSPSEIDSFSANLEEESPFESGELLDESLTGAKEEGGSILMRYLRNDR